MRRFRLLTAAVAALAVTTGTSATVQGPPFVALDVVDRDSGTVKPQYEHDHRRFVAGETAAASQRGYVLSPYESADISGWRKSVNDIAAFRFAPLAQSYAARTGRPGDVGVIGVAVFREALPPPPPLAVTPVPPAPPVARYAPAAPPAPAPPAPMAAPLARAETRPTITTQTTRLGTAHGEIERDPITLVSFVRASTTPASVRSIEYDSTANLIAAGVIPGERRPRAFPGDAGFVPDPPAPGGN